MTAPHRLHMAGIDKRFGPTVALSGVDLQVEAGEIHALVGENGAGKSTLMKILSGAVRPDAGVMALEGRPFQPASPIQARLAGVAMIYQELNLAPHLTVAANITLGVEDRRWGFLRAQPMRTRGEAALKLLDQVEINPEARVQELNLGARQIVEVARALVTDASVIVMDEPTSSLTAADTDRLFRVVERLAARGRAVIYISHFLEEVQRLAHNFTVLRDGKRTGGGAVSDTSLSDLIEMMVGRQIDQLFPRADRTRGEAVLVVEGLHGHPLPAGLSFRLHRGEILGIAGLVGAGRTEMLRAVYALDPVRSGAVKVKAFSGQSSTPAERIRQGLGLLSEDRKGEGLAVNLSIEDNITLSALGRYTSGGIINLIQRREACSGWMNRLGLKARDPKQRISDLSGGNQQKAALARLLHQDADVLLLDEPTRGIDVASKVEIYNRINNLARQGTAILLVSSYLPELLGMADRLAVMHRGRLTEVQPIETWTEASIMTAATGGKSDT